MPESNGLNRKLKSKMDKMKIRNEPFEQSFRLRSIIAAVVVTREILLIRMGCLVCIQFGRTSGNERASLVSALEFLRKRDDFPMTMHVLIE